MPSRNYKYKSVKLKFFCITASGLRVKQEDIYLHKECYHS